MIRIDYPDHDFRIEKEEGKDFIFDELRKRWIRLNPEEWVRQQFLQYLLKVMNYPAPLIAIEKEIRLNDLKKRFDILVYNRRHQPWMMVECKAPSIELSESVLQQVLRYNIAIPVPYLIITNGTFCMGFRKDQSQLVSLIELPLFEEMN